MDMGELLGQASRVACIEELSQKLSHSASEHPVRTACTPELLPEVKRGAAFQHWLMAKMKAMYKPKYRPLSKSESVSMSMSESVT